MSADNPYVITQAPKMGAPVQNLFSYLDLLYRVTQESMEVALVVCKNDLVEFTMSKLFDVFNQILPSAFVLGTGYWPFYISNRRQSVCVCARYAFDCRHVRHDFHWLNLEKLNDDDSLVLCTKNANMILLNYIVEVVPVMKDVPGYCINMRLIFMYRRTHKRRVIEETPFEVGFCSRYYVLYQHYPAMHSVSFQPNPFTLETYGSQFRTLRQIRQRVPNIGQSFFAISVQGMQNFTIGLYHVSIPRYHFLGSTCSVNFVTVVMPNGPILYNKTTQTENVDTIVVDDNSDDNLNEIDEDLNKLIQTLTKNELAMIFHVVGLSTSDKGSQRSRRRNGNNAGKIHENSVEDVRPSTSYAAAVKQAKPNSKIRENINDDAIKKEPKEEELFEWPYESDLNENNDNNNW